MKSTQSCVQAPRTAALTPFVAVAALPRRPMGSLSTLATSALSVPMHAGLKQAPTNSLNAKGARLAPTTLMTARLATSARLADIVLKVVLLLKGWALVSTALPARSANQAPESALCAPKIPIPALDGAPALPVRTAACLWRDPPAAPCRTRQRRIWRWSGVRRVSRRCSGLTKRLLSRRETSVANCGAGIAVGTIIGSAPAQRAGCSRFLGAGNGPATITTAPSALLAHGILASVMAGATSLRVATLADGLPAHSTPVAQGSTALVLSTAVGYVCLMAMCGALSPPGGCATRAPAGSTRTIRLKGSVSGVQQAK